MTTSLVSADAAAVYVNHLVLLPKLWHAGCRWAYAAWLVAAMCLLTAGALVIMRVSYATLWGPDIDPWGAYRHYAIDLFGMVVHVGAAAGIVRLSGDRAKPVASSHGDTPALVNANRQAP